ncbi:MAG: ATP-binding protein [Gammaproteobacteria bacterium]|nr:ATP-binding protein [Gammaproteobacteria bacterium]
MRSLLIRIFASFWSIIVITIIAAAAIGFWYAERTREIMQNFEDSDAVLEASAALSEDGRDGLADWLRSLPGAAESLVFVVDDNGKDLLGRQLPSPVRFSMARASGRDRGRRPPKPDTRNIRPARPFTQLVGPDDRVYTIFVLPARSITTRWLVDRGRGGLVILALLVSAMVSYWLARTISRPVRRFRESANAIAGGNLDTRVAESVGKRRDEIGLLAQDFDRMADELQRAWLQQTELTRNVSHELRSPLARLRVALELARRKTGDLVELDKIDAETERLDELIGRILEYSRLDSDSHEVRSSIALDELLRSVVEDVRYEYGYQGAKASIELEADTECTIDGYPNALRSCVENVIRNAVQHSRDDGDVHVQLSLEDSQAVISVEDQGGGVREHELERIFEPFYRSTARQGEASRQTGGLGLAIASRATALNGGTIAASNAANGLCVEIRLPVAD